MHVTTHVILIFLLFFFEKTIAVEIYKKKEGRKIISYHLGYIGDNWRDVNHTESKTHDISCNYCHKKNPENKLIGLIEATDDPLNNAYNSGIMRGKNTFSNVEHFDNSIRKIGKEETKSNNRVSLKDILCSKCIKNNPDIPDSNFLKALVTDNEIKRALDKKASPLIKKTGTACSQSNEAHTYIKDEKGIVKFNKNKYWYGLVGLLKAILPDDAKLYDKVNAGTCSTCDESDPYKLIILINMKKDKVSIQELSCTACSSYRNKSGTLSAILTRESFDKFRKIKNINKMENSYCTLPPFETPHKDTVTGYSSKGTNPETQAAYLKKQVEEEHVHTVNFNPHNAPPVYSKTDGQSDIIYLAEGVLGLQTMSHNTLTAANALQFCITSEAMSNDGYLNIEIPEHPEETISAKVFWDNRDGKNTLYFEKKGDDFAKAYDINRNSSVANFHRKFNHNYRLLPETTRKSMPKIQEKESTELERIKNEEYQKLALNWKHLSSKRSDCLRCLRPRAAFPKVGGKRRHPDNDCN